MLTEEAIRVRSECGSPRTWMGGSSTNALAVSALVPLEVYEGYVRREIVPTIGGLEVAKLRPGHVRAVLTRMQQRGLSAATIAQARVVLSSALRQALDDGLITLNPVAAVKRPRIRRAEPHWPTMIQLAALLETSKETLWEVPILLGTVTGARRSEILGISWEDVDLQTGTIFIRRGVQRMPLSESGDRIVFTPLKTKRANRLVRLPSFALDRIRGHRREQLEHRSALGPGWHDPLDERGEPVALVCERGDGSFLHPDSFTHSFKRLARQAGLHPSTRLHDVRHAVATELGRRGVHSVIVSRSLGHASPAFTAAVYQHAWQEGPYEVAEALEEALAPCLTSVGNPLAREALDWTGEQTSIAN